jgi:hypothetical protein
LHDDNDNCELEIRERSDSAAKSRTKKFCLSTRVAARKFIAQAKTLKFWGDSEVKIIMKKYLKITISCKTKLSID